MNEPRPFASLTSGLLARKGAARPAMRPQLQPLAGFSHDDLGWNDLGHDTPDAIAPEPLLPDVAVPEVIRQQEAIAERIGASAELAQPAKSDARQLRSDQPRSEKPLAEKSCAEKPAPFARLTLGSRRSALSEGRRAAFTLRVDADRHLKLRLACTVRGLSAQQLITEALDRLLDSLPEVSTIAARVAAQR